VKQMLEQTVLAETQLFILYVFDCIALQSSNLFGSSSCDYLSVYSRTLFFSHVVFILLKMLFQLFHWFGSQIDSCCLGPLWPE
jgi:hypothetical protein